MRSLLLPLFLVALDIISTICAFNLAIFVRFDYIFPAQQMSILASTLPIFCVISVLVIKLFRLYNRLWRYAGSSELIAIVAAGVVSTGCWYGYSQLVNAMLARGVYVIAGVIFILMIGGYRLILRIYNYFMNKPSFRAKFSKDLNLKNVLIVGAGDAASNIAREMERYHSGERNIVGFIDDDKKKIGSSMVGLKVLGNRYSIIENVKRYNVEEIIVAMPSVKGDDIKQILEICRRTKCELKILPGIYEIIKGNVSVSKLRKVQIEDLLGREVVDLKDPEVDNYIKGKTVLVTGAGGSIGSEICRQIASVGPKQLIMLGKGENSIYEIDMELSRKYTKEALVRIPVIADVRDKERINEVMQKYHPDVVFHAAAHKHVPLMEYQPIEAVKNNVWGTKVVAEAAVAAGVSKFVMVSTDKAVNPTSVMGCTKRVAEMYVQSMNSLKKTKFVAVRFGNVLGSRGSVIPLFRKLIEEGRPLTVTHPEMKRYFMTIPEASQLVLQAGAMARGGEVFVLDMGEPVYIKDLAENMIRLSGLEPGVDIEIQYTGLRPGEKLFEELLSAEDGTEKTNHEKIFTAVIREHAKVEMDGYVEKLLSQVTPDDVVESLKEVVPTYKPNR